MIRFLLTYSICLLVFTAQSQTIHYARPIVTDRQIPIRSLPSPNLEAVRKSDSLSGYSRIAVALPLSVELSSAGLWTDLPNGDRIWQLMVTSSGARALLIQYEDLYLPGDCYLQCYLPGHRGLTKSYTQAQLPKSGKFITGFVKGDKAVIALYEPATQRGKAKLRIDKVHYAYESARPPTNVIYPYAGQGFGDALDCHININCPEAQAWQQAKRSVVRILRVFEEGAGWCTGSLINNTAQDGTPYVLSASHCHDFYTPIYDLWRFDFHYETPTCANDTLNEPIFQSIWGGQVRARRFESDFSLIELNHPIPLGYRVRFNGWNRTDNYHPAEGILIQHPNGDVKKFARDEDTVRIHPYYLSWGNGIITPPNYHLKAILDQGTMEVGSSGSPLLDADQRVVGQLHGGRADCSQFITYSGRIQQSWASGDSVHQRLREWLDPLSTDTLVWDAWDTPDTLPVLEGQILNPDSVAVGAVTALVHNGNQSDTVLLPPDGTFSFDTLALSDSITISFHKHGTADNGVNVLDLLLIQNHVLQIDQFEHTWQILASDVDANGKVNVLDLVYIQAVILRQLSGFPAKESWQFMPNSLNVNELPAGVDYINIIGFKTGDVNVSSNPQE